MCIRDRPLNAPCFPVDQTIQDGQAVNFGYMLRPPHGDSSALPEMCIRDRVYLEQAEFCKIQSHKNKKGWLCVTAQK